MNLKDTIYHLTYQQTIEKGGGTFGSVNLTPLPEGWPVFILSMDDDRGVEIPLDEFDTTRLTLFVERNRAFIAQYNDKVESEGHKEIGTWVHDGVVYLDVVTLLPSFNYDRSDIEHLCRLHHQRAYYDNLVGETVWVA
jgi:hypothetical protein